MKKSFLIGSVLSLLVLIFPVSIQAQSSPRQGGDLVLTTSSDPKTFNGILGKDATSSQMLSYVLEGLTTTNPFTAIPEPHLARSWDISEDGLTWTFHLREDVFWSDGEQFTADDVLFTYNDLIFNDEIPSSARDIFTIDGQRFAITKVDDHTVQFILPVRFAPFLISLGQSIYPEHKLRPALEAGTFNQTWTIDTDLSEIVGTGPFLLSRYDPGQRLVFRRNPTYWKKSAEGEALPYLDKLIYMIVQNADIELLKFMEGTVDVYGFRGMDYPLLKPLEAERNFTIYDLGPATGSNFLTFNQNSRISPHSGEPYVNPVKLRWFTDLDFRRAVAHAIDKDKIIEIVKNGLGYPQHSPIGPGAGFFHKPDVAEYDYDLARARAILDEAGYRDRDGNGVIEGPEGQEVVFTLYTNADNNERIDIASIIRYDLEKLGMDVNFKALEFNTLVGKLTSNYEWEAVVMGLTGGIEPHFGKNVWDSSGQLHMWNPVQETPATAWEQRVNELFSLGVQELDPERRKVYYDEFQEIVARELPVLYTVLSANVTALRNKFGNVEPSPFGGVLHNLEEIYVLPEYQ